MPKGLTRAIQLVNQHAALLVFPIKNKKEPLSLWKCLYPRSEMRWEWDQEGDDRVADLWHLRAQLAESRKVVYSKWYQNRATLLRLDLLPSLLVALNRDDRAMYEQIVESSPISTKELKKRLDLKGSSHEAAFQRSLQNLFRRLLIVGTGEVEDGAFPSLAVGATKFIFEEEWQRALKLSGSHATQEIEHAFEDAPLFWKYLRQSQDRIKTSGERGEEHKKKRLQGELSFEDVLRMKR